MNSALIFAYLNADTTFTDYLTGGFYNADDHDEISDIITPAAFDETTRKLLPTALLKPESDVPTLALERQEAKPYRYIFSLMFYVHRDSSKAPIHNAKARAFTLLHGWKPAGQRVANTEHAEDIPNAPEDALEATMVISRYVILYRRS
jgi:hypothetical protein